ncbi:MAG: hypothetical protein HZA51_14930 [Planctomycetes bacterium]|nr:hypothetical protein [Planctomycetota bacterium]
MRTRLFVVALSITTTCVMNHAEAGGGLSFQTVALSGQAAPGTGGRIYSFFYPPSIGSSGRVVFPGWLTGATSNDEGLWSGLPGSIQLVAREGSAAPGTTGVFGQNSWTAPSCVNSNGTVAFTASLTGPGIDGTNNTGIWVGQPGALALVARAGNAAPGTPAGVVFSGGMQNWLMLNDLGHIVFRANLVGPGITTANDAGIWAGAPGALQLVAREGDVAPGTGGVFDLFNYQFEAYPVPVINAAGDVVFSGHHTGGRGIWRWSGGVLELVARTNTNAPGTSALFEYLFDPWMNASGELVFKASLMGEGVDFTNNNGIWAGVPGAVGLVVRKGSPAPGTSGLLFVLNADSVGLNSIDDGGFVTILSSVATSDWTSTPGLGIWRYGIEGGGSAWMVYSDPAPGMSGVIMGNPNTCGPHPASSMPFPSQLTGTGVTNSNDECYWLKDVGSSPRLIVRENDQFDIGGGVMRTIGTITTSPGGHRQSGYNANRQMVIGLGFAGGSSGIFAANVPVPAMLGDMNCDGAVNGLDVDGFALAIVDPLSYASEWPNCDLLNGNINLDSVTDIADIELFVMCVMNGGCP